MQADVSAVSRGFGFLSPGTRCSHAAAYVSMEDSAEKPAALRPSHAIACDVKRFPAGSPMRGYAGVRHRGKRERKYEWGCLRMGCWWDAGVLPQSVNGLCGQIPGYPDTCRNRGWLASNVRFSCPLPSNIRFLYSAVTGATLTCPGFLIRKYPLYVLVSP